MKTENDATVVKKRRGRKPSASKKKYYFGVEEEMAFHKYAFSTDQAERDAIFREKLYPAFTKMVESIIRTYILFVPTEDFEETFCDTMSFLVTKVNNFNPKNGKVVLSYDVEDGRVVINGEEYVLEDGKMRFGGKEYQEKDGKLSVNYPVRDDVAEIGGRQFTVEDGRVTIGGAEHKVEYYKLFSYCGTVCKNYLMYKRNQDKKKRDRMLSYDLLFPTADKDTRVDDTAPKAQALFNTELINRTVSEIQVMLSPENIEGLTENERQIGYALLEMLMNWEEIFKRLENKKFNKTSVWFFLKEYTRLSPKDIREGMKRFKDTYFFTKEKLINE